MKKKTQCSPAILLLLLEGWHSADASRESGVMGRKLGGMSVWGITNLGEWVFGELVSSNLGQCVIWGNWCLWSAATDPPVAGFSAYGGYVVLGPHGLR